MSATETIAAGLAVRAADTGRVLMLQRSIDDIDDPNAGKWEFPGGKLENGETPIQGAIREWQQETGSTLPAGEWCGSWKGGVYEGFVLVVPSERHVHLNVDADDRLVQNPDDPDGDWVEVLAWWAPSDARSMPALRAECGHTTDWALIDAAVPDAIYKDRVGVVAAPERYEIVVKDDAPPPADDDGEGDATIENGRAAVAGPTSRGVHVDRPLETISISYAGRRKKLRVVKAEPMKQIVYGVVLEPDTEDTQGDIVKAPDVEIAAHRYLKKAVRGQNTVHRIQHGVRGFFKSGQGLVPVENFIAPCDFSYIPGGEIIKKGSWVLAAHIEDPKLWQDVLDGKFTGWSVGGKGVRSPISKDEDENDGPDDERDLVDAIRKLGSREAIPPPVHELHLHIDKDALSIHVPEQAAPVVHNHVAASPAPEVHNHVLIEARKPGGVRVETGEDGTRRYIPEDA